MGRCSRAWERPVPCREDRLFCGLCLVTGLMPVPVPGLLPTDSVPPSVALPCLGCGRDTFPVTQAPSISTNSALQLGMVNQPLTQRRREGCAKSSRGSETAPHQPAAPSQHCFPRDRQAKREPKQPDSSARRFELWGKKSNAGRGVCRIRCQALLSAPAANNCPAQSWWASQGGFQHSKVEH